MKEGQVIICFCGLAASTILFLILLCSMVKAYRQHTTGPIQRSLFCCKYLDLEGLKVKSLCAFFLRQICVLISIPSLGIGDQSDLNLDPVPPCPAVPRPQAMLSTLSSAVLGGQCRPGLFSKARALGRHLDHHKPILVLRRPIEIPW